MRLFVLGGAKSFGRHALANGHEVTTFTRTSELDDALRERESARRRYAAACPGRIGTKSFELHYELRAGDRAVAAAKTVLVGYDYERQESTNVPEGWRRRLTA